MDNFHHYTYNRLAWDSDFFGLECSKAVLYKTLSYKDWEDLKLKFSGYQFITIENRDSDIKNAEIIAKDTTAFLADVNIQFHKILRNPVAMPENVVVSNNVTHNDKIIEIADFAYSRFTEDKELANRNGAEVYTQWIINSFHRPDKYFALAKTQKNEVIGFLLHSYTSYSCIVELIAVDKKHINSGIGTRLFYAIEHSTLQNGRFEIKVGTQIRNINAINFYHKIGCKQVGCHQIYHLWNL